MPSRKYAPKRKLRRTKGRRTRRKYGKKRGGLSMNPMSWFNKTNTDDKTGSATQTGVAGNDESMNTEGATTQEQTLGVAADKAESLGAATNEVQVGDAGNEVPEQAGGRRRRRRRSSKKRSSKKSRKSRRTRRRHRGGCVGHSFQPSIVNPPNSALANPAPFARYTTGP